MPRADPLKLAKVLWPDVYFYKQQRDIIRSVWFNDETVVTAGNMLGKDFVAGRLIVLYFLEHYPCRIVTTSTKDDHLRVLWGEIGEAIASSKIPLSEEVGGPLILTHHELRRIYKKKRSAICYVKGMVASNDSIESLQGHHAKFTLFVSDESSSIPNPHFKMANGWAKKKLLVGNPWDCANYFYQAVEGDVTVNDPGGDIPDPHNPGRYYRKVIRVRAEDSPNVRLALAEIANGKKPSNTELVPGVKSYQEYAKNRLLWDPVQQCVSLDAEFYKGKEVKLFPWESLKRCAIVAMKLRGTQRRARCMGVDAAEGGDSTVWTVIDGYGIIFQLSLKTADTADIPSQTIALMKQYQLKPEDVVFDRGGGGKQHADRLRRLGYDVRTVGFGEAATDPHVERKTSMVRPPAVKRVDRAESRYAYKNRRAEMYGLTSELIAGEACFGIPAEYAETIRQLKVFPKKYDSEGRLYLPPKDKPNDNYTGITIKHLLGRSPDEADSLVLAVFGMLRRVHKVAVGA